MSKKQKEILQYYSNLMNYIDIKCENAILFFKTEDAVNEIETNRQKIISKIKQIEMIKLENVKDSETLYDGSFGFFISNDHDNELFCDYDSEYVSNEKLDLNNNALYSWTMSQKRGEKFDFVKHLGQLVVASSLSRNNVRKLINGELKIKFDSDFTEKESTKFQVYAQLIKNKNDHVIIDLSLKEKNQIDSLKLTSNSADKIPLTKSGFELIPTYLDAESVRELKIVGYGDREFPTQIFRPFKNLNRLEIKDLFSLKSLNENSFIGLESLEILELSENRNMIDIKENTFKALINLKLLIFTECKFPNFHKTSGLENLKALKIKRSTFEDFRLEYLELFKNLENLQIFISEFVKSEIKSLDGFEKLKILETDLEEEIHLKSNLEILSFNVDFGYSLTFLSFKPHVSLNGLKFLCIRNCSLNQIEHLNQLNQLEFLDFFLHDELVDDFNQVNLPKLKYLMLTCHQHTPNFNQSLQNLQGLELIDAQFLPRDRFINLKSLDYLAITNPEESMFDKSCGTTFRTIKNLKFLKIESSEFEFFYDDDKRNEINEKLSKLFESPENVLFHDDFSDNKNLFEQTIESSSCLKVSKNKNFGINVFTILLQNLKRIKKLLLGNKFKSLWEKNLPTFIDED
ncbi:LRR receptor-like serine threonine- kinase FLS2 isoform X1 [Brachionus plicatilis]|uniref:LRR receptor-like serine threonine-kinase FLS2 isoform X1 n=1 Tax=Brachionus plicatilis TaxID=10195 RepID=A0A3M7SGF2_BRAPC|nr:LRR receptor-like serine threonine- kinase FLS2 isoform X1 [Brachionus plicatilis]